MKPPLGSFVLDDMLDKKRDQAAFIDAIVGPRAAQIRQEKQRAESAKERQQRIKEEGARFLASRIKAAEESSSLTPDAEPPDSAQDDLAAAVARAEAAELSALRYKYAAQYQIDAATAELLLTGPDSAAMEAQARRLSTTRSNNH